MRQSFWILAATFCTVLTYVFVKAAPEEYWFGEIFFVRSVFLLTSSLALLRVAHISPRTRLGRWQALRCLMGTSALLLNIVTVQHLPVATAQTLAYTSPLFVALLVVGKTSAAGRPVNWPLVLATVFGFVGICLVIRPVNTAAGSSVEIGTVYALLALISALCAACAALLLRHLGRNGEPTPVTMFYFSLGCLITATLLCLIFGSHNLLELFSEPALLMVGLCTVGAQLAQTQGWGRGKTLLCANLQFSAIVFSTALGWLFFDETFDLITYAGIALILTTEIASTTLQLRTNRRNALINP